MGKERSKGSQRIKEWGKREVGDLKELKKGKEES